MRRIRASWSALALAALLAAPGAEPAAAASFVVDDTADAVDALPGDGLCASATGSCPLRAAVQEANALAGADEIALPAGLHQLSLPGLGEDAAATGDLDITGELAIRGERPETTVVDAAGLDRVFDVLPGGQVELVGLTIRHGAAPDEIGGGVANEGLLVVERCHVVDNTALLAGGLGNFGTLHVRSSRVEGNAAWTVGNVLGGGGIGNSGDLFVEDSTIRGNAAVGTGGGIGSFGHAEVVRSTIEGNHADGNGGGLVAAGGSLALVNATVSGNTTRADGGGVSIAGDLLTLHNTTVTANTADADGDGVGNGGGVRASAGAIALGNSIVADNFDPGGEAPDCSGSVVSEGYNLIGDTTSCSIGGDPTGNLTGVSAQLAPLAYHGGPTDTHQPLPGSPVLDSASPGGPTGCEPADQRGLPRPQDGDDDGDPRCDMGAFELPEPAGGPALVAGAMLVGALAVRRGGRSDGSARSRGPR